MANNWKSIFQTVHTPVLPRQYTAGNTGWGLEPHHHHRPSCLPYYCSFPFVPVLFSSKLRPPLSLSSAAIPGMSHHTQSCVLSHGRECGLPSLPFKFSCPIHGPHLKQTTTTLHLASLLSSQPFLSCWLILTHTLVLLIFTNPSWILNFFQRIPNYATLSLKLAFLS